MVKNKSTKTVVGSKLLNIQKLFINPDDNKILILCAKCNLKLQNPIIQEENYLCPICHQQIPVEFLNNEHITTLKSFKNKKIIENNKFIKNKFITTKYKFVPKGKRVIWTNFSSGYVFNKKTLILTEIQTGKKLTFISRIDWSNINASWSRCVQEQFLKNIASFLGIKISNMILKIIT